MTVVDEHGRQRPPEEANEIDTLLGFLDFQRATFDWKCRGLDATGMHLAVAPSPMTLAGLMKHLALVEEYWFTTRLWDREQSAPWNAVDWDADPDWDWHSAAGDTPEQLRSLWSRFVDQSRANVAEALSEGDLEQVARNRVPGDSPNLRWILCHMIEEYARHNGHTDYLREAVDGQTGE